MHSKAFYLQSQQITTALLLHPKQTDSSGNISQSVGNFHFPNTTGHHRVAATNLDSAHLLLRYRSTRRALGDAHRRPCDARWCRDALRAHAARSAHCGGSRRSGRLHAAGRRGGRGGSLLNRKAETYQGLVHGETVGVVVRRYEAIEKGNRVVWPAVT